MISNELHIKNAEIFKYSEAFFDVDSTPIMNKITPNIKNIIEIIHPICILFVLTNKNTKRALKINIENKIDKSSMV